MLSCLMRTWVTVDFFLFSWRVFDGSSFSQLVRDKYESYPENGGGNQSPVATGMVHQAPSFGSDSDWMEPSVQLCHSRVLQPHAYDQVYNAFDLLRTEPSVQVILIHFLIHQNQFLSCFVKYSWILPKMSRRKVFLWLLSKVLLKKLLWIDANQLQIKEAKTLWNKTLARQNTRFRVI